MSPDRLSPQDASFLHIEDDVSHMHIASVSIFEGPPPPFEEVVAMVDAKLDLVPRYRQRVQCGPVRAGPARVGRRPALQHRVPPAPHRPAGARGRARAAQAGRARHGPAAGPLQATLGDLGGRGPRGRSLGHAGQDPPRHGRRHLGHRSAGGDHGPEPRDRAARAPGRVGARAHPLERVARRRGAREHGALSLRAAARGAGADPRAAADARLRHGGDQRPGRAERARPPHAAVEPERAPGAAPALRLGDDVGRRHQAGAQGARRVVQRCRAGVASPTGSATC